MLSHATARDWLVPYADGRLAGDERARVDSHIAGCASCGRELRNVRELNLLLVTLPPAPAMAFAPFWFKLQSRLPQRLAFRIPSFTGYRRLGVALAIAAVAMVAAVGTAFAAPSALPNSPIYPVKQLEEGLQLAFTPQNARLALQVQLANERLREAQAMAANHKPELALKSLRAFGLIVDDAAAELKNQADPRVSREDVRRLRAGLQAVKQANAEGDDDSRVSDLVLADLDDLDRIHEAVLIVEGRRLIVGEQATPEPSLEPTPQSTPAPQPTPEPSELEHHRG